MKAKETFNSSIEEISILNNMVNGNTTNDNVLFKSIILLLCAKLEKFVKDSCKEYIENIIKLKPTKSLLSETFIKEIILNEIKFISDKTIENYLTKSHYAERSKVFSLIWDTKYKLENLNREEFEISITKNGTNEFSHVYKKIGFPNIIEELEDFTFSDMYSTTSYSIKDKINGVISMRHNIIHDDANPQITPSDIKLNIAIFKSFVDQIDENLENSLKDMIQKTLDAI